MPPPPPPQLTQPLSSPDEQALLAAIEEEVEGDEVQRIGGGAVSVGRRSRPEGLWRGGLTVRLGTDSHGAPPPPPPLPDDSDELHNSYLRDSRDPPPPPSGALVDHAALLAHTRRPGGGVHRNDSISSGSSIGFFGTPRLKDEGATMEEALQLAPSPQKLVRYDMQESPKDAFVASAAYSKAEMTEAQRIAGLNRNDAMGGTAGVPAFRKRSNQPRRFMRHASPDPNAIIGIKNDLSPRSPLSPGSRSSLKSPISPASISAFDKDSVAPSHPFDVSPILHTEGRLTEYDVDDGKPPSRLVPTNKSGVTGSYYADAKPRKVDSRGGKKVVTLRQQAESVPYLPTESDFYDLSNKRHGRSVYSMDADPLHNEFYATGKSRRYDDDVSEGETVSSEGGLGEVAPAVDDKIDALSRAIFLMEKELHNLQSRYDGCVRMLGDTIIKQEELNNFDDERRHERDPREVLSRDVWLHYESALERAADIALDLKHVVKVFKEWRLAAEAARAVFDDVHDELLVYKHECMVELGEPRWDVQRLESRLLTARAKFEVLLNSLCDLPQEHAPAGAATSSLLRLLTENAPQAPPSRGSSPPPSWMKSSPQPQSLQRPIAPLTSSILKPSPTFAPLDPVVSPTLSSATAPASLGPDAVPSAAPSAIYSAVHSAVPAVPSAVHPAVPSAVPSAVHSAVQFAVPSAVQSAVPLSLSSGSIPAVSSKSEKRDHYAIGGRPMPASIAFPTGYSHSTQERERRHQYTVTDIIGGAISSEGPPSAILRHTAQPQRAERRNYTLPQTLGLRQRPKTDRYKQLFYAASPSLVPPPAPVRSFIEDSDSDSDTVPHEAPPPPPPFTVSDSLSADYPEAHLVPPAMHSPERSILYKDEHGLLTQYETEDSEAVGVLPTEVRAAYMRLGFAAPEDLRRNPFQKNQCYVFKDAYGTCVSRFISALPPRVGMREPSLLLSPIQVSRHEPGSSNTDAWEGGGESIPFHCIRKVEPLDPVLPGAFALRTVQSLRIVSEELGDEEDRIHRRRQSQSILSDGSMKDGRDIRNLRKSTGRTSEREPARVSYYIQMNPSEAGEWFKYINDWVKV